MMDGAAPIRPRILVADDEPSVLHELALALPGYAIQSVTNGEDALAALVSGATPDVILLDVMMPGPTGFDVCERVKRDPRWREIPVIFMTALGDHSSQLQALAVGAADYLNKPFTPEVVRSRVAVHANSRITARRLAAAEASLARSTAEWTDRLTAAREAVHSGAIETIVRLSRAAEFRDNDTGAHLLRIGHYAAAIGLGLGLGQADVALLLRAAPLHDVGKIAIPDRILLKHEALNQQEWEIMRQHPVIGGRILKGSPSDVIRLGETVALTHHERWDGGGYPAGLAGRDIPLAGRIVAVADVFDALATNRPYKPAFPVERALDNVRSAAGIAFDPSVVDAFCAVEDEILEVHASYPDRAPSGDLAQELGDPTALFDVPTEPRDRTGYAAAGTGRTGSLTRPTGKTRATRSAGVIEADRSALGARS